MNNRRQKRLTKSFWEWMLNNWIIRRILPSHSAKATFMQVAIDSDCACINSQGACIDFHSVKNNTNTMFDFNIFIYIFLVTRKVYAEKVYRPKLYKIIPSKSTFYRLSRFQSAIRGRCCSILKLLIQMSENIVFYPFFIRYSF